MYNHHMTFLEVKKTFPNGLPFSHSVSWTENEVTEHLQSSHNISSYMYWTFNRVTHPFLRSKCISRMSTLLTQPFLKSCCVFTILTKPLQRWKRRLSTSIPSSHSCSPCQNIKTRVPYVYHLQQAIPDVKMRVRNVYHMHHHTAFLEVQTHFQMIYHPPPAFRVVKMRFQQSKYVQQPFNCVT